MQPAGDEYPPSEDTFFLADHIAGRRGRAALDVGCGSGYLTSLLSSAFEFVVGTDINLGVLLSQTYPAPNLVCCSGASSIRGRFDLIVCNMPYLATESVLDISTDGGPRGIRVPGDIIDTIPPVLGGDGRFLFVSSSLSDLDGLAARCRSAGLVPDIAATKRLFFEELVLFECRLG